MISQNDSNNTYLISSRTLYDLFSCLNTDPDVENIVDVSGTCHGSIITMERIELIEMAQQEVAYAKSDLRSTFTALMEMDTYGSILTGVFHIHPGEGQNSAIPSKIDILDQRKREQAGYLALGGIFSRDGHILFFSDKMPFSVVVKGKGIKQIKNNLFRLEISKKPQDVFTIRTQKIKGTHRLEHDVFQRHTLLSGFQQERVDSTSINLVGAGGLGSEIGMALIRKGIGELNIYDGDTVTITNLTRQHFFKKDLYKPKATCLAHNLANMATNNSILRPIPMSVQEAERTGHLLRSDIAIVGVDNYDARFFCSKSFHDVPTIFTAISPEADSGWVFLQEPGKACFGCFAGDMLGRPARKCTGSSIDINKVMGGLVSYVVDSLIMNRPRDWNYKRIFFTGPFEDISKNIDKDDKCKLCS